jgi:hypothetical protein
MGLTISSLFQSLSSLVRWSKEQDVRILMLGLDSAGKVCRTAVIIQTAIPTLHFRQQYYIDCRYPCYLCIVILFTTVLDWRSSFHHTQYASSTLSILSQLTFLPSHWFQCGNCAGWSFDSMHLFALTPLHSTRISPSKSGIWAGNQVYGHIGDVTSPTPRPSSTLLTRATTPG